MKKLQNTKLTEYRQRAHESRRHTSGFLHYAFLLTFLLLQIGVLILVVQFIPSLPHLYLVLEFLSFFLLLFIVREDSDSSYKVPWLILILAFPVLGALSYMMFAHVRFSRGERKQMEDTAAHYTKAAFEQEDAIGELGEKWPGLARQANYIRHYAAAPLYKNTSVQYFSCGEEMYEQLVPALEKAEKFIFVEYFIVHHGVMWDTVEKILMEKAKQGLDVRVMYDDIGSVGLVQHDYVEILRQAGIQAFSFNKLTNVFSSRFNNRDHRKIVVIDGNVGFTGGVNMADEYINVTHRLGHWSDSGVMLQGEAVRSLTTIFLSNWDFVAKCRTDYRPFMPTLSVPAEGYVQPYGDSPYDGEMVGENVYCNILNRARRYVYITTPYLVIDDQMVNALKAAAKCGVDVRIITPGIPDKKITYTLTRSYYEVLMRAGVRIYEYTPGFMHAKQFVSDDSCAVVGTINLDYRSLCHHFECAVWMCRNRAVLDVKRNFLRLMEQSTEVELENTGARSLLRRVWQAALRVVAPLF